MKPKYLMLLASLPIVAPVGIMLLPTALAVSFTFLLSKERQAPYMEIDTDSGEEDSEGKLLFAFLIVLTGVICNVFWSNWLTSLL